MKRSNNVRALRQLQAATRTYLEMLNAALERWRDDEPFGGLRDLMWYARNVDVMGTPKTIAEELAVLLGEAPPHPPIEG